jgi:hypothetical protein
MNESGSGCHGSCLAKGQVDCSSGEVDQGICAKQPHCDSSAQVLPAAQRKHVCATVCVLYYEYVVHMCARVRACVARVPVQ